MHEGYKLELHDSIEWFRTDFWMALSLIHSGDMSIFTENEELITAIAKTFTNTVVMDIPQYDALDELAQEEDDLGVYVHLDGEYFIQRVINSYFDTFPDMAIGAAFGLFFGDPDWEHSIYETGEHIVVFTGGLVFNHEDVTARLEFVFYEGNEAFWADRLYLDGVRQNVQLIDERKSPKYSSLASTPWPVSFDIFTLPWAGRPCGR